MHHGVVDHWSFTYIEVSLAYHRWKEQLAEIKEQRRVGEKLVPILTLMDPKADLDVDVAGEMVRLGLAAFTKASLRRPGEKRSKKRKSREGTAHQDE